MTQEFNIFPYIARLLQGDEVVWKQLGEVASLKRGRVISKEYLYDNVGEYPVYSSQTVNNGEIGRIKTFDFEQEAITWTTDGANAGTVFYREGCFSITNVCGLITIKNIQTLNYKYLYYWLSIEAKKHVYSGMGNPKLMSNQMEKLPIPLPPLSVQQEIVRILDKFTQLEAELEAELDCRKRQYEYYRNKLLSYEGNEVEWKTLGEVATYSDKRIKASSVEENNYIGVENLLQNKAGKIISNYVPSEGNVTAYNINDVLIGNIRPYLKKIWLADNYGGASGDVLVVHIIDNSINAKYLYHILADDKFFNYNMKYAKGAKMPRGDKQKIMDYLIPLPPLEEQQRIATILDKFDTLVNSISEGLPKEIALRRKQYEYYREKLLSFSKE